jgi:hypothetical protein
MGLAKLLAGSRQTTASARRAGMEAFTRINDVGGAERQSIFYANAMVYPKASNQVDSVYSPINSPNRIL